MLAIASLSKFLGSILGAQLSFLPLREGAALGVGLNARGALEIVIATVGLSLDVLNDRSYTVIVLMAMATSMAAPPLLRRALSGWEGTPEERQRLDMEAQLASNIVVRGNRILIPTKGDVQSLLAAQVAGLTWPADTAVTLLTAGDASTVDVQAHRDVLFGRSVDHDIVDAPVADAVAAFWQLHDFRHDALVAALELINVAHACPELLDRLGFPGIARAAGQLG